MTKQIDISKIISSVKAVSREGYPVSSCPMDNRLKLLLINRFPMYHGLFRSEQPYLAVGEGLFPLLWRLSQALLDAEGGIWRHGPLKLKSGKDGIEIGALPDHLMAVAEPYLTNSFGICSVCGESGFYLDGIEDTRCLAHHGWDGDVRHTLQVIQQLDEPLLNLDVVPATDSFINYHQLPTLVAGEQLVWYIDLLTGLLHCCRPGDGDFRYDNRGWPMKGDHLRELGLDQHPNYWLACSKGIREARIDDPRLEKILRFFVDLLVERVDCRILAKRMMLSEHPVFGGDSPVIYARRSEYHYDDLIDTIRSLPKGAEGW